MTEEKKFDLPAEFSDLKEVKSNWIKWGKVGDYIRGTLTESKEISSTLPGKEDERNRVYEIMAECGKYHDLDNDKKPIEPAIELKKGDYYLVSGGSYKDGIATSKGGEMFDNQLKKAQVGQVIGIAFVDEIPPIRKGFSAFKLKKVMLGDMNHAFLSGVEDTEIPFA